MAFLSRRSATPHRASAVLLSTVICMSAGTPGDQPGVPPAPTAANDRRPLADTGAPVPLDPAVAALVEQAKMDLARRQSVTPDAVALVEVRSVTWPDTGLGCPRPGVQYLQVTVDGFLIRLSLGDRIFHYHQGRGRPPFLCEPRSR